MQNLTIKQHVNGEKTSDCLCLPVLLLENASYLYVPFAMCAQTSCHASAMRGLPAMRGPVVFTPPHYNIF